MEKSRKSRIQKYKSKSLHRIRMCAGTWAAETLLVGGETRAAVPLPASSPGSAAAPVESPPASEFQHEPSHLTYKTCESLIDSDSQTVSKK